MRSQLTADPSTDPVCQCVLMDPLCDGKAIYDLDGSGVPYLCASCERRSRGQGGEERATGAVVQ